ncbi:MAG: response regulator [Rhodobacterales bacterium]|nr:response regulator [Rhodobacterales bacterium]
MRALKATVPKNQYETLSGTWTLDLANNQLVWSANTYRIFGLTPDIEDLYDTSLNAVHPDDRDRVRQADRVAMFGRNPYKLDYRIILPDGEVRQVYQNAEVLFDANGSPIRIIGAIVDLTEHRVIEADQAHARHLKAIKGLAGGVAHDFNNLLGAILMTTSMALEDLASDTEIFEDLDLIQQAAKRGAALAGKLLSLAKKQPLSPKQCTVGLVIDGLQTLLKDLVPAHITLEVDIDAEARVHVDETQIQQALLNLCINAIEAMPDGGVLRITAKALWIEKGELACVEGPYVRIEVSDNGEGMAPELLADAFQSFFTTKAKGTGFGLATAHGITRQHHGDIRVTSTLGVGSRFSMFLPKLSALHQNLDEQEVTDSPLAGSASVLLAEDDPTLLHLITRILQSAGYQVQAVLNGQEAVEEFERKNGAYDIAVFDTLMPVLGGVDAAKQIRKIKPGLPILFCSGYSVQLVDDEILNAPQTGFLAKPFEANALLLSIHQTLA